jgi:predicted secreted Zn-dependent protease
MKEAILRMPLLMIRLFSLAVILAATFASAVIQAEPIVAEDTQYYKITGFSERGLRDQMTALGPNSYAGYTQCRIHYNFRSKNTIGGCVITSVVVNVNVTYTMPKWTNKSDAPLALQDAWEKYYSRLYKHEMGHRDIAVRNARPIEQGLLGLQGPSAQAVHDKAQEISQSYIEKAKQEDAEYDRITEHGKTQGLQFP